MAAIAKRLDTNVEGDFYVDDTCIDCGACRWIAPESFNREGSMSRVFAQPESDAQSAACLRALIACPTASIGAIEKHDMASAARAFPYPFAENVFFCGYTSESSFGAASWLIQREAGNVLIDSPRFAGPLVKRIEEMGGIDTLFLTHRDDIADHAKFRERFGCERIIHADDGIRGMEREITGVEAVQLDDELTIIPTPGHTRGSACLLYRDEYLFTGDHLAWSLARGHLVGFRTACWYSWPKLIESMRSLLGYRFKHVVPGHGAPFSCATHEEMREAVEACVEWCEEMA